MNYKHSQVLTSSTPLEYRKEFFRKPIILITAIIYTVLTLLAVVQAVMPNLLISTEHIEILLGAQSTPYITMSNVFGAFIMTLITLSVWMIYIKSNSENPMSSPSTGFTILYLMSLISLLVSILAFLIILALAIMFLVLGPNVILSELLKNNIGTTNIPDISTIPYSFSVALITALLIIAFLFILLYPIAIFKFISSLKSKPKYTYLPIKGCMLLAILNIPIAISTISSIFAYPSLYTSLLNETVIGGNLVLLEKMNYFPMIYLGLCGFLSIIMVILPLSYRSFAKRANQNLSNKVQYSRPYFRV